MELGQHCGVDLVGLDLGPGDGPNQDRICYDHPAHKGREQPDDRARIACRLDDDLVIRLELRGELQQTAAFEIDPPGIPDFAFLQDCHLSE